jgi:hypothetical protein
VEGPAEHVATRADLGREGDVEETRMARINLRNLEAVRPLAAEELASTRGGNSFLYAAVGLGIVAAGTYLVTKSLHTTIRQRILDMMQKKNSRLRRPTGSTYAGMPPARQTLGYLD